MKDFAADWRFPTWCRFASLGLALKSLRVREWCSLGLPVYQCCRVFRSNIREMRTLHKDTFLKKHNLKLGFMSAFVKAAAFALQDQPVVNAGEC